MTRTRTLTHRFERPLQGSSSPGAPAFGFGRVLVILLGLAPLILLGLSEPAPAALPAMIERDKLPSLAPMLKRVTPAIVNIATQSRVRVRSQLYEDPIFRHFFNLPESSRERTRRSLGSGVIVDASRGYLLTNYHVVENADAIMATLRDGRSIEAKLIGADPESDIALLQIDAKDLTALPMADSERLEVGDFVVAIGNPFGLTQTVTSGIVSALGRSGLGIEGYEDFIQTDASINVGNSGGALVNLRGELVGINTAILAPSGGNVGIGFAIPVNMAGNVMRQILEHGDIQRGQLGVHIQNLTPDLAQALNLSARRGALIAKVLRGGAAEKAGLRPGDVITEVNGRAIEHAADLRNAVGLTRAGETVELRVVRRNRTLTLRAKVAPSQLSEVDGERLHRHLAGATFGDSDLNPGAGGQTEIGGVRVLEVEVASPAWNAGLRKGDIIVSVNRQPIDSVDGMRQAAQGSKGILLNIHRGNAALFLAIR
jgi:Do/DeqQ family serine protease